MAQMRPASQGRGTSQTPSKIGLDFSAAKAWQFDRKRITICHVAKSPAWFCVSDSTLAGYPKDFATFLPHGARLRLKKLDEIFPGPGGEAPQAYAW
jgi:hypothetical protein